MDSGMQDKQIKEIQNLKAQLRYWRWGLFAAGVLVVAVSVGSVHSAFNGLVQKGPRQDQFVEILSKDMNQEVKPLVEDLARQTLNEVRPEVNAAVERVNARLPELAQATLDELDQMQENLPKRGTAVLERTFAAMLVKKEDELQKMFPEATPEQIERLLTNLGESATAEAGTAAVELFGRHHEALENIHANLEIIRETEAKNLAGVDPSWEMGLLVLDLFREDLNSMRPDGQGAKPAQTMASATDTVRSAKSVQPAPAAKPVPKNGEKVKPEAAKAPRAGQRARAQAIYQEKGR